jgi:hypothetical protein
MAKLFMRSHEMGQIKEGNYADCLLVDGNPLENIRILQDHTRLNVIIINGRVHKAGVKEYIIPSQDRTGVHSMTNEMVSPVSKGVDFLKFQALEVGQESSGAC